MHAHERTLLASLGFSDADKKDARHDLACQYLATPESAARIYQLCPKPKVPREISRSEQYGESIFEFHLSKGSGQYRSTIGFLDLLMKFDISITQMVTCEKWGRYVPFYVDPLLVDVTVKREYINGEFQWGYYEVGDGVIPGLNVPKRGPWVPVRPPEAKDTLEWRRWEERNVNCWFIKQERWSEPHTEVEGWALLVEVKIKPVGVGDIIRQLSLYETYAPASGIVVATAFDMTAGDVKMLASKGYHHIRLGKGFEEFVKRQSEKPQMSDSPEF